ncbi:MAG: toprim domain-containing protein [Methanosarcinales archaeon]
MLDTLREESIIVEGKRDREALNTLGITNVIDISSRTLETFIKSLDKNKKYVVLTDFDEEGERKNKKICRFLERNKFNLDLRLRQIVKSFFGITKIEELIKFSKLKEDVYHGKISTIDYKIFNRSRFHRKWCSRETRRDWGNIWTD